MQKTSSSFLLNSQIKDSGGKLIFDDNALCAQFLRNYVDILCLAGVEPEDIEDVSEFRSIAPETLGEILKETPKHLLDKMANIMLAFLLKVNVPVPEAEELVERVREKKMAELFECMEKMDIQEERRKTAEQKRRAEEAEERTEEQRKRAEEAEGKAAEQEKKYLDVVEKLVQMLVENAQETGEAKIEVLKKLASEVSLEENMAKKLLEKYWKS
ncbi:MAG: hypothetical protein IJN16_01150 [Lachnospiraceae bacterium]|nr:hypothetical protein [Lachnospiraceae bacterium]